MSTVKDILAEAHGLAEKSKTWADLSNALFDPLDGLVAKYIKSPSDRAEFRKSDAYGKLHELVEQKMKQTGVVAGAEPKKSGRFVVRLPKTMHAALEHEAAEGIEMSSSLHPLLSRLEK
jgi:predicted HicB family RNase H-like nuclease